MNTPQTKRFTQLNLAHAISRCDDLLMYVEHMRLDNKDAMIMCRNEYDRHDQEGDILEALAWYMAYGELQERQIRLEDPQVESTPNWNGGFGHF